MVALEQRRTIAERELNAYLRECARRRTAAVREFLANDAMRQLIPPTVWRTAACRAAGLRDPLALEVSPSGEPRELRCRMGQLPAVELHFVNRDPDGRSLDLRVFENLGGDLAVECTGEATERRAVRLVPHRREGGFYGLLTWSLAPGGAATVPARLGDFVEIAAPGTYHLRFVFREDGDDFVDAERNELRNGFLFLCSDPFTLIVEP